MSLILQRYNPGLSDEDRYTSTNDRYIGLRVSSTEAVRATAIDTAKGRKHIENSKTI